MEGERIATCGGTLDASDKASTSLLRPKAQKRCEAPGGTLGRAPYPGDLLCRVVLSQSLS